MNVFMEFLNEIAPIIIIAATIIAVCVGSFLNVIIARLPEILDKQYKDQAYDILDISPPDIKGEVSENIRRRSACPVCHQPLKPWHNIPIISFIFLRGKCSFCHTKISWLYPSVELISGLLVFLTLYHFGVTFAALSLCLMYFFLIPLTAIDLKHFMLPDNLTLPLLWLGLIINCAFVFSSPIQAVLGAVLGYGILWLVFWVFKFITKKEGMGYGDFKLMAALGAWFGAPSLLFLIFTSAVIGIVFAIIISLRKRRGTSLIPFGPSIAIAGVLYPFIGQALTHEYFQMLFPHF
ncbi:type 4 prepilin-like proteins leader peptide-processing enzyme [Cysteiniphilum litorale]|uniref:Prepilin leader peptidase/N-methyltransferase n=2 Tax=Fastidiosibacteraceae TaxID=2056687 RepID=A0A8J2Z6C7_9GAMM|nr:type 4 prepilin-like proteins leader peptide-processing enzyme [Cysteiniphilum litorale]